MQIDDRILHQIKKVYGSNTTYGGFLDIDKVLSPDVWIASGSYFYGSIPHGKVIIDKDCELRNCRIEGNVWIKRGVKLTNCELFVPSPYYLTIDADAELSNQVIRGHGVLTKQFLSDGKIRCDDFNGTYLICTNNFAHVNCRTFTYEDAWEILHNEEIWNDIKNKTEEKEQHVFSPATKEWLLYWCEKQLWRKTHSDVNKPTRYCEEARCPHYFGYCNMRLPCEKSAHFSICDELLP